MKKRIRSIAYAYTINLCGTRVMMPKIETGCNKQRWSDIEPMIHVQLNHCDVVVYDGVRPCAENATNAFRKFILDLMSIGLEGLKALPEEGMIRYKCGNESVVINVDQLSHPSVFM